MSSNKNNLKLNDINARLLSLEKKLNKITYSLDFLIEKVNDIHNETFSVYESSSSFKNISPISSPCLRKKRGNFSPDKNVFYNPTEEIHYPVQPTLGAVAPTFSSGRKNKLPNINNKYARSKSS